MLCHLETPYPLVSISKQLYTLVPLSHIVLSGKNKVIDRWIRQRMIWCLISCKSPLSMTIFITLTRYVICKCSNSVFFILRRSNVSTEIPYFPYFFCKNRKTSHIPPIFGLQKFPYFPYFFPKVWWGACRAFQRILLPPTQGVADTLRITGLL